MKQYQFYHKETGVFGAKVFTTTSEDALTLNMPADHASREGVADHLSQRVDVATGALIDYQPPAPSPDHEWQAETKRWELAAAVQTKRDDTRAARQRIAYLESAVQPRAMREHALAFDGAADRLRAIDDEIAALRRHLA